MIPAVWYAPLPFWAWEVGIHSLILGAIFYIWAARVRLPSGRPKRRLLAVLLVLPVITASVPGRANVDFRERVAWLDSSRLLAVPLGAGVHVYHLVALVGVLMIGLTLYQELWPVVRRPRTTVDAPPEAIVQSARALSSWEACRVVVSAAEGVIVATGGWPGRPTLVVSRGAIAGLSAAEMETVIEHEHAHWHSGRWIWARGLFLIRLLQCCNPVALWCFREYCLEVEVACDAEAARGRNRGLVVRPLLRIYESIDRRDVAARSALRKRVDVLLAGGPEDQALPLATIVAAAVVMLGVLPWIV